MTGRRLVKGRPLTIGADDYNAAIDHVERARKFHAAGTPTKGINDGCIWVKNNDATGRKVGEVLKLGASITAATSNGFPDSINLAGTDTTAAGESFAVMQEACGPGEVQRGMVIGICQARLNITNADHGYADTAASSTTLVSAAAGPVKVLWKESGTGAGKWAIVQMGASISASNGLFLVTLAQDGGGNGGTTNGTRPTWTYTLKEYGTTTVLKKADGTNATGLSPLANTRLPWMAGAATYGTATRQADGTLILVEAFEDYANIEGCT